MSLPSIRVALASLFLLLPGCAGATKAAFLIPIQGMIDDEFVLSVTESIEDARSRGAEVIFFEIDSPGGTVFACHNLAEGIDALEAHSVMLVFGEASQGAALLAIAGDEIVMGTQAALGKCQLIMPNGSEGVREKVQAELRRIFRSYAERNGYPLSIVEAFVTENRLLTATEARDEGFCGPLAENRAEALSRFSLTLGDVVVLRD
jgi:membrane-bound serine protease (ClpP class)